MRDMRDEEEILKMRRRISALLGKFNGLDLPWTDEENGIWVRLFNINVGLSWALGNDYILYPFKSKEELG